MRQVLSENTLVRNLQRARERPNDLFEIFFKVHSRNSSVYREVLCGAIHFLSLASCLSVNPMQLSIAGYSTQQIAIATAIGCGIVCILTGLFATLPFVSCPTLACSIYLSTYMKINRMSQGEGNCVVFLLGCLLILCSFRSLESLLQSLIPTSVKLGIVIGLALLVSLQVGS